MRTEQEIEKAAQDLRQGILDNYQWRSAVLALDFVLEKNCKHALTGEDMDLQGCEFCKKYFMSPL
jgi:hypothetical protein